MVWIQVSRFIDKANGLTLKCQEKFVADDILYFLLFSEKIRIDISCESS